jgi:hypothetical protein
MVTAAGNPVVFVCALGDGLAFALPFVFLRAFVESNPVIPAPEAGAVKLAGGPSCTSDGRSNFWKRGGLRGSVCGFGVSGSVMADCAIAAFPHIIVQAARSRHALRGVFGREGRKRGTMSGTPPEHG